MFKTRDQDQDEDDNLEALFAKNKARTNKEAEFNCPVPKKATNKQNQKGETKPKGTFRMRHKQPISSNDATEN